MKTPSAKAIGAYVGIFLLFAVIAFGFAPGLLSDKVINQPDRIGWTGVSKEAMDYNNANPDDKTLWSNSMFGGMPTTTFYGSWTGNLLGELNPILDHSRPGSYLLVSLVGGFLLMLAFGTRKTTAVLGAIAITFCSYNLQIAQAGHNTKMLAIAYMPWVLASIVYAYRHADTLYKQILAAALFGIALSLQIQPNHPQITYYLALIVLTYAITELVMAIKSRTFKRFAITSSLLLVLGICGIATVSNKLIPLFEYTEYTMRGGSGLEGSEEESSKGLDLEYATAWSYGINEMPNLMIPDFNGGSSHGSLDTDSNTYRLLAESGMGNLGGIMNSLPLYWGPQPFTVGPMYIGAIVVMLALLGLIISSDKRKWWLLAVSLFAILLAWGSHIMGFTELMFKYLPFYNKFRTVSMSLVILQITTPLLAVMGIMEFLKEPGRHMKGLYTAAGITGGIALLVSLFPGIAGSFTSPADTNYGQALAAALREDRISLLRHDALRTLIYILLAGVALLAAGTKTKAAKYAPAVLCILVLADLWGVDKRYLNEQHFISERQFEANFKARPADLEILKDKDLSYRVADIGSGVFNDSFTSYFHKNIGGYSPAKLSSYQNIIDRYLTPELNSAISVISQCSSIEEINERMPYMPVMSMLNCRYLIIDGNYPPATNSWALGNAWVAGDIKVVSSDKEALESLSDIDPRMTAVLKKDPGITPGANATITLTSYSPKRLEYESVSDSDALAVFSEIYYPAGWTATIDGKEAEILCANYLLRALTIPEGSHKIVFEFDPESYHTGATISTVSSAIILLFLLAGIAMNIAAGRRKEK